MRVQQPRDLIAGVEARPLLDGGWSASYGVFGVAFESGHALALRRSPACNAITGRTSVWHRTPVGLWTEYRSDPSADGTKPDCRIVSASIRLVWTAADAFTVLLDGDLAIRWDISLRASLVQRLAARLCVGPHRLRLPDGSDRAAYSSATHLLLVKASGAIVSGRSAGRSLPFHGAGRTLVRGSCPGFFAIGRRRHCGQHNAEPSAT